MIRSALANGQSLTVKAVTAIGVAFFASAMATPAMANSAAAASDSFRIAPEDVKANQTALGVSDPEFRTMHDAWGKVRSNASTKVAVSMPSINPVEIMNFSSGFGYRHAPTKGASSNHKGVDIPGPIGTPIYATADGTIGRAQWVNGYGKYVEIEHGNEVETRYGHMSALNVVAGQKVKQGDVIGYMGSTGRSTGSHLHYEVRVNGIAVNPMAFLAPASGKKAADAKLLLAAKQADSKAMGGPAEDE